MWTYRCLTLGGYIVDCPHRERLGYGGDAGTSFETGMFNFDVSAMYIKWMENWYDKDKDARSLRGDSWGDLGVAMRCSYRYYLNPGLRNPLVGFRVV